jgi:hypothetical protein
MSWFRTHLKICYILLIFRFIVYVSFLFIFKSPLLSTVFKGNKLKSTKVKKFPQVHVADYKEEQRFKFTSFQLDYAEFLMAFLNSQLTIPHPVYFMNEKGERGENFWTHCWKWVCNVPYQKFNWNMMWTT